MLITRLSGHIGATVDGIDVRKVDEDDVGLLQQALDEHHVLFLRDQDIDDAEHLAFARHFGPIELRTPHGKTNEFQYIEDSVDNPPQTDQWHTDHTCLRDPPGIAFLWAHTVPPYGGDTVWASLSGAYDALSPTMRSLIEQLKVRHSIVGDYWDSVSGYLARSGLSKAEIDARFDVLYETAFAIHPLVITHPTTRQRALYLSPRFAERIEGLEANESALLLGYLEGLLDDLNIQVRWQWREHDLAIWDERSTNHRALADHFAIAPQHRVMRRCTVAGPVPVLTP